MSSNDQNISASYMSEAEINQLTMKQRSFCEFYQAIGNYRQAAISAGYSPNGVDSTVGKLKKMPLVDRYMRYLQSRIDKKKIADAQEIQELLTEMSRGNVQDELVTPRGDKVNAKIHTRERIKAADLLAAIQGIKTDNIHLKADQVVQFADDLKPTESK